MNTDELFMKRCLELAYLGVGAVFPNPMVGAVIVHQGKIIGEGYHKKYGEAHAEVNAVNSVKDTSLLSEATIYVSLEPCAHFGKTPPCADLLVLHKFKKVVIACQDTFSEVSGKGIERLKNAGIEVVVGVLEQEARELNHRFFTFHEQKRPYVILKWAQTKDGFIDRNRTQHEKGINWITGKGTKQLVHKWRSEEMAILVGKTTVLNDNPSLTVREWRGNNPIRIILDSSLEIPENVAVFSKDAPTIVFNTKQNREEGTTRWIKLENNSIAEILAELYRQNIQSVIVEGGKKILESFLDNGVWDEARILIGNTEFKEGIKAPLPTSRKMHSFQLEEDTIEIHVPL